MVMTGLNCGPLIRLCRNGGRRRGDPRVTTTRGYAGRTGRPLAGCPILHILPGTGDGPATALTALTIVMPPPIRFLDGNVR